MGIPIRFMRPLVLIFLLGGLFTACEPKQDVASRPDTLFELLPASQTGVHFTNALTEDERLNIITFEYFYNGGGVGVGDINNDGLPDLFLGGNMVPSRLYLNRGDTLSPFQFKDITESAGIHTEDGWTNGIAMVDINGDGFLDIYVCRAGPHGPEKRANQLYINQGNNTFQEQASQYGLADTGHTTQAAFFDYDRDGDLDVYLLTNVMGKIGPNIIRQKITDGSAPSTDRLYRNDGPRGNGHRGNGNGKNGQPTFTNVSKEAGIRLEGYGLGVSVVDVNRDGWPDVYVSNDYLSNDILYINQQNGTFRDEIADYFKHQSYSAMGNDAADIDNDGLVDFFTVDMLPEDPARRKGMFGSMNYDRYLSELQFGYQPQFVRNTLQHNNGQTPGSKPSFSEIGRYAGIQATDWSWSALFADYDNDGYRDLMVTNGYPKDITNRDFVVYRMELYRQQHRSEQDYSRRTVAALKGVSGASVPNYLFRNNGGDLTFTNQSAQWGFDLPSYSHGAAYADLDNDGDLDLVINNLNREAFIYRNTSEKRLPKNHYLRIRLRGKTGNPYGFGTKVSLYYDGQQQFTEHSPYRGYQSTVENTLHFGLGKVTKVDSIRITWLDGQSQVLTNVAADQVIIAAQRDTRPYPEKPANQPEPLFREVSEAMQIRYRHTEELYIDFKVQPLLPCLLSQNGPGVAVGDMNGDGLEDFFVGGAFNHSGELFFQQSHNRFRSVPLNRGKKYEEDMAPLLFDADRDGDLDLYVVSGSSEFAAGSPYYQDRLYTNDGKGKFTLNAAALPPMPSSGSCVTAADFDRDGDLDLFVGGRLSPTQYPLPAKSYVLRNDSPPLKNGSSAHFTDVTDEVCPEMNALGMVTASLWTDFDGDGWVDLLVTGEWMPITFFKNQQGKLIPWNADAGTTQNAKQSPNRTRSPGPLTHSNGWWNSLVAGDFDGDGDVDYVAGNLGLNTEWRTSSEKPVSIYAGDYDGNGSLDPVLCQYQGDSLYPVHPRDEMINQMNGLRKNFPRYTDYAKARLTDVFSEAELKKAYVVRAETFRSVYLENKGKGQFSLRPLPAQAQLAPVFGMLSGDYDEDGHLDLLLTGNSYATEAITGPYDASIGLFLHGDGKGNFTPLSAARSGFVVEGDAKGLAEVALSGNRRLIIATRNNATVKAFLRQNGRPTLRIQAGPMDAGADIIYTDGHHERREFYYGSAYLSQSSRTFWLPANVSQVTIYDFSGKSRPFPGSAR
jgi:enediyne biosynthesis protein E4